MNLSSVFINRQTMLVRSGWRALVFIILAPQLLLSLLPRSDSPQSGAVFKVDLATIIVYAVYTGWVVLVSWLCLRFLDHLSLASLGLSLHHGWWQDILKGCLIGSLMIIFVIGIQFVSGGTQITANPVWWQSGTVDYSGLLTVGNEILWALILLIFAATFEESLYRGYPFQTILRGGTAFVPILLFASLFGIAHLGNPNRTFFSTANTVLAGVWLSVAYLKTRSLWLPTSLHFTWNWFLGAFFGLPVSGLRIPQAPLLVSSSEDPVWLTGGSYGSEGGAAATAALIVATILIWRAKWLTVSPEMQAALVQAKKIDLIAGEEEDGAGERESGR
jgi:membrane protease YdiL (CAAX protease family)